MVVDFIGMQLLIYPLIYAHGHHAIAVARARAKRQTVQRVHRALLLRHLGTRGFLVFPGESHVRTALMRPAQAPVQEQAAGILSAWAKVSLVTCFPKLLNNQQLLTLI